MITNFNNFKLNEEIKNYPLYKGVMYGTMFKILKDNKIKSSFYKDEVDISFDSELREIVAGKHPVISASRSFETALSYGRSGCVFEFDMFKLSSRYRIVPFCENPDYYLNLIKDKKDKKIEDKTISLPKMLRDKDYSELYWKVKTDPNYYDFGICEELIVAKDIDITKYVKTIYTDNKYISLFDDLMFEYGIEVLPFT